MSIDTSNQDVSSEAVSHLLSLGVTQLSIQVTLSTSLTASALGLATLATALTSTILTLQDALAPDWQWTLLPSIAATLTGLLATAGVGAEQVGEEDVHAAYSMATSCPHEVGTTILESLQRAFRQNDSALETKRRLVAATFASLLLTALSVGLLNVVGSPTLELP